MSTASGEIDECTMAKFLSGEPIQKLFPHHHRFCILWQSFISSVTTPGSYNRLIDVFVAIKLAN
jgi:hypothetical protein